LSSFLAERQAVKNSTAEIKVNAFKIADKKQKTAEL
jgi:hypothetical protein